MSSTRRCQYCSSCHINFFTLKILQTQRLWQLVDQELSRNACTAFLTSSIGATEISTLARCLWSATICTSSRCAKGMLSKLLCGISRQASWRQKAKNGQLRTSSWMVACPKGTSDVALLSAKACIIRVGLVGIFFSSLSLDEAGKAVQLCKDWHHCNSG